MRALALPLLAILVAGSVWAGPPDELGCRAAIGDLGLRALQQLDLCHRASLDTGFDTRPLIGPVLLSTSVPLTPLHPGLALLETAWEWAEPIVFAARLAVHPLPGHAARSIYEPIGLADPEFPDPIYAALALASGTQQAGDVLLTLIQESLAVGGLDGVLPYPRADHGARSTAGAPRGVGAAADPSGRVGHGRHRTASAGPAAGSTRTT